MTKREMDRGLVELNSEECKGCGLCVEACPPHRLRLSDAINRYGVHPVSYDGAGCTGCGICFFVCPEPGAITVLRAAALKPTPMESGQGSTAVEAAA